MFAKRGCPLLGRSRIVAVITIGLGLAVGLLTPGLLGAASQTVTTVAFSFSPSSVTIGVGDSISWTGVAGHTVTSDSGAWPRSTSDFSFTFQLAGTYPYHCEFHVGMNGVITVQAPPSPTNTSTATSVPPSATPTRTSTPSPTPQNTGTPTNTPTPTPIVSPTVTATVTSTAEPTSLSVTESGGTITTGGGGIQIEIPSGAVDRSTLFAFTPRPLPTPSTVRRAIGAFALTADGGARRTFDRDVVLTIRFAPSAIGPDETVGMDIVEDGRRNPLPCTSQSGQLVCTTRHFTEFVMTVTRVGAWRVVMPMSS